MENIVRTEEIELTDAELGNVYGGCCTFCVDIKGFFTVTCINLTATDPAGSVATSSQSSTYAS
jgi:hypothetical protein